MNIGDYVRTNDGYIYKIKKIPTEYKVIVDAKSLLGEELEIYNIEIIKSSPNIIDLIEVGDVITTNNLCGEITKIDGDKIYTTCYDGEYCSASDIKSIVTKEMFANAEYRVETN